MKTLEELGIESKEASRVLGLTSTKQKNNVLQQIADALQTNNAINTILSANEKDIANAKESGMSPALIDRLLLTKERIEEMANGIIEIIALDDPVGTVISETTRPNGLNISQVRVPFGVIGIIYESRPNVTVDAFALCFKTGNAVILRGGSDAIHSNLAITEVIRAALADAGMPKACIAVLEDTSRETARKFMLLKKYVDLLIPRGGAGLIRTVVETATIPVIETGTGNCHIYVDKSANPDMAINIIHNAKLQRLGVCNACESLVIHREIAPTILPAIVQDLLGEGCEVRGDDECIAMDHSIVKATMEDYGTEYLAKIISVKLVDSTKEAIAHINQYSTGHSESIITESSIDADEFLAGIDSSCVYVNASTRFTDGFEFGFGAEIGISTQKLHARGPMGLLALTSYKYQIRGTGQIR